MTRRTCSYGNSALGVVSYFTGFDLLALTVGAGSGDVQGVRGREESLFGRELIDHACHRAFERDGGRHVDHLAAARAEKVMVVVQEALGHLETGELVARRAPTYDAGSLEVREVSIGRTPRDVGHPCFDIGDTERP